MPEAQTALNMGPSTITQIEVPQTLIASGVNTNSTNSMVWTLWNHIYAVQTATITTNTMTGTTTSITNADIWSAWVAQAAIQAASMTVTASTTGASYTNSAIINNAVWSQWNDLHHATAEQVVAAQRYAREQEARRTTVQLERSLAEKRAEVLLQEVLSAKQREELAAKGYFTLKTIAKTGEERFYRIRRGRSRNIDQVDAGGRRIRTLCAHPVALVPDADTMVAQKLMLESQEEDFLRIANVS